MSYSLTRHDFHIVESARSPPSACAFDANFVAWLQFHVADRAANRGMRVGKRRRRRHMVVRLPFVDQLVADKQLEFRHAVLLVEILHAKIKRSSVRRRYRISPNRQSSLDQLHGPAAGGRFPRRDLGDLVAVELLVLGFKAVRIIANAALVHRECPSAA